MQLAPDTSLRFYLEPLQRFLDDAHVLEVVVNRPGEVFVEGPGGWQRYEIGSMDLDYWLSMARALATFTKQRIDAEHPLLAATLPDGQRVQIVVPPAVPQGRISVTIRRASSVVPRISDLAASGLFDRVAPPTDQLQQHEQHLLELKAARRFDAFMVEAVRRRLTILACGHTGSGKTHILKALCQEIDPCERIVTIEDTREVLLPTIPNAVHLLYSAGGQGLARVSAQQLLHAALRMRPDRILLSELRGGECFDFVSAAASGHPGSMSTVHASTPKLAFQRMALMMRQSSGGAGLGHQEILSLLLMTVDVILQFGNDGTGRYISQVWYDPARKLALAREEL
jgi:type IV secretion system protein VirB11